MDSFRSPNQTDLLADLRRDFSIRPNQPVSPQRTLVPVPPVVGPRFFGPVVEISCSLWLCSVLCYLVVYAFVFCAGINTRYTLVVCRNVGPLQVDERRITQSIQTCHHGRHLSPSSSVVHIQLDLFGANPHDD